MPKARYEDCKDEQSKQQTIAQLIAREPVHGTSVSIDSVVLQCAMPAAKYEGRDIANHMDRLSGGGQSSAYGVRPTG